jgi:hypothetical protein
MNYGKLISLSSFIALTGYILSGPAAFLAVNQIKPQPKWISPGLFVENYSILQDLLVGGMLMLVASHYLLCKEENTRIKFPLLVAVCLTIIFSTLITFNYICQTTFVHNLALNYSPEHDAAISMFSMSNPLSFCWANEMWGYGILGVATWLMAGYYKDKSSVIFTLLIANGIMSIVGVVLTIYDINWVMTTGGLIAYFAWNVLMIALMICIFTFSKQHLEKI